MRYKKLLGDKECLFAHEYKIPHTEILQTSMPIEKLEEYYQRKSANAFSDFILSKIKQTQEMIPGPGTTTYRTEIIVIKPENFEDLLKYCILMTPMNEIEKIKNNNPQ